MENLSESISTLVNFLEVQFTQFREKMWKILVAIGLLLVTGVLFLVGFAMTAWGIYLGLSLLVPPFVAAIIDAGLAFGSGVCMLLIAKRKIL
ncbi:phage holin family protein [Dehalobacter sp. DCM]|uniref:phage holin family protein n=1 Tax=Dehalobacter sp. DCM TaxID=2907827 RepID=UPI0030814302|nr:phage holin family protein [Dehalobacter sp. DCM]